MGSNATFDRIRNHFKNKILSVQVYLHSLLGFNPTQTQAIFAILPKPFGYLSLSAQQVAINRILSTIFEDVNQSLSFKMPLWLLEVFTTPVALAKEFIGSLAPPHLSSRLADKYFTKTSQKRSASPTIHTSALKHKLASGSFLSIYSAIISLETTPAFLPSKQKVSSKLSNKSFYLDTLRFQNVKLFKASSN